MWVAGTDDPGAAHFIAKTAKYGFGFEKSCIDPKTLSNFAAQAAQRGSFVNSGISDVWRNYGALCTTAYLP